MYNGSLMASCNIKEAIDIANAYNARIIYIGEPIELPDVYKNEFIIGAVMSPDYNTLAAEIDGNIPAFEASYIAQLQGNECVLFFATILTALRNDTNIILLFPEEGSELRYVNFFLNYLKEVYGIVAGTKTTMFENRLLPSNVYLMYMNNLIPYHAYLIEGTIFDEAVLSKLYSEFPPSHECKNLGEYAAYIQNVVQSIKNSQVVENGVVLASPVIYE